MARAYQHYLPGNHIWHITHRCRKRELLLKFAKDRSRWFFWILGDIWAGDFELHRALE